jgi:hypothetical protein
VRANTIERDRAARFIIPMENMDRRGDGGLSDGVDWERLVHQANS